MKKTCLILLIISYLIVGITLQMEYPPAKAHHTQQVIYKKADIASIKNSIQKEFKEFAIEHKKIKKQNEILLKNLHKVSKENKVLKDTIATIK